MVTWGCFLLEKEKNEKRVFSVNGPMVVVFVGEGKEGDDMT